MSDLLPINATEQERALSTVAGSLDQVPVPVGNMWNPDSVPAIALPWLAWALSVENWHPDWPESVKRATCRAALQVHRTKGTRFALEKALFALSLDFVIISEWFEQTPAGGPFTFEVEAGLVGRGLGPSDFDEISAVIDAAKNVRSHLSALRVYLQQKTAVPVIGAVTMGGEGVTIYPWITPQIAQQDTAHIGAGMQSVETITVYPPGA